MSKTLSRLVLILIISLPVLVRAAFGLNQPYIKLPSDSYQYFGYARDLFHKPAADTIINPYRTPAYPLLVGTALYLTDSLDAEIADIPFARGAAALMLIQSLLGIMGTYLIYRILLLIQVPPVLRYAILLINATNMLVIPWERVLLTESLATFWIILLSYVFVRLFKHPAAGNFLIMAVLGMLGPLIRPAVMILPIVASLLIFLYHRKLMLAVPMLTVIVFTLSVPFVWQYVNGKSMGYHGFQVYTSINSLGRIMADEIPIESAGKSGYFYSTLSSYRRLGRSPNPYDFLSYYDALFFAKSERLNELALFTGNIISHQPVLYLGGVIRDIPKSFTGISPEIRMPSRAEAPFAYLLVILQKWSLVVQFCFFLSIIVLPVAVIRLLRKISPAEAAITSLGILAWSQIFINTFYGYEDYGRLSSIVMPIMAVFTLWWTFTVLSGIINRKSKS